MTKLTELINKKMRKLSYPHPHAGLPRVHGGSMPRGSLKGHVKPLFDATRYNAPYVEAAEGVDPAVTKQLQKLLNTFPRKMTKGLKKIFVVPLGKITPEAAGEIENPSLSRPFYNPDFPGGYSPGSQEIVLRGGVVERFSHLLPGIVLTHEIGHHALRNKAWGDYNFWGRKFYLLKYKKLYQEIDGEIVTPEWMGLRQENSMTNERELAADAFLAYTFGTPAQKKRLQEALEVDLSKL